MGKLGILWIGLAFMLSGCVVRTYPQVKDRVDQDLSTGNRGYLKGQAPSGAEVERKASRRTQVVEIELHSPIQFEKRPKLKTEPTAKTTIREERSPEGNRGYITQSITPEIAQPQVGFQKYTVQKNDTLQKISKRFYGTTKKWKKIYDANRNVLRGPDKVYPGQVIYIPQEAMAETGENLK